mgnify:CR=1 FL=1
MNNELRFLLYRLEDENVAINAFVKDETIWLTQKAMAELFGVQPPAISKHLKNIIEEGELDEKVVISKMETTTTFMIIYLTKQLKDSRKCLRFRSQILEFSVQTSFLFRIQFQRFLHVLYRTVLITIQ